MNFDEWLEAQEFDGVDLLVLVGIGSKAEWPAKVRAVTDCKIVAFEPRERVRNRYTLVPRCLVCPSLVSFRARLRSAVPDIDGDVVMVDDSSENIAIGHELVTAAKDTWDESVYFALAKQQASQRHAGKRVTHMLESFDLLIEHPPINLLHGKMAGRAGVVVGAGPSLDKNIHVLRTYRERLFIAAVNTSLPALDVAGIEPDICVVCEAKPVGATLTGIESVRNTVMVPGCHVARATYDLQWAGIMPALSDEGIFGQWATRLLNVGPIPIGSSVATLAAGVLFDLGCDPIVLVGNDCAPADTGHMYAANSAFDGTTVEHKASGGSWITKSDAKLGVEDIGNKDRVSMMPTVSVLRWDGTADIKTMLVYDAIRQWFEEFAELIGGKCRLINATQGGVFINGWEHIRLADVIDGVPFPPDGGWNTISTLLADKTPTDSGAILRGIESQIGGCVAISALAIEGCSAMRMAKEMTDESSMPIWGEIEKNNKDHEQPAFELLEQQFRSSGQDILADLMVRARDIQRDIGDSGPAGTLLDAKIWGELELARRCKDTPVLDVFERMFQIIIDGAGELREELETLKAHIEK